MSFRYMSEVIILINLLSEIRSFENYIESPIGSSFKDELKSFILFSEWSFEPHIFQEKREYKKLSNLLPKVRNLEYREVIDTIKSIKAKEDIGICVITLTSTVLSSI